jgi:hypothetical protein
VTKDDHGWRLRQPEVLDTSVVFAGKALAKADFFFLRALSAFDALTRSEEYIHHENVDFRLHGSGSMG